VDLSTGRTFMVGAFPYAVRKMLDLGMVNEFKTGATGYSCVRKYVSRRLKVFIKTHLEP